MVASGYLVVGGVVGLLGLFGVLNARTAYDRYTTLSAAMIDRNGNGGRDDGTETTVQGPVQVTDPAVPERPLPDSAADPDGSPAVWAWRIRRKVKQGSGKRSRSRWKTVDGGVAVGDASVREHWDHVRIDADRLTDEQDGATDPFESSSLYLGTPEIDVPLGELDPVNKLLEKWGLRGEDGLLSDVEFTISIGRQTLNPDRYQATVIRDGDELLARGDLEETGESPVLRGTDDTPLVLAAGDLDDQVDRLRSKARRYGAVGGVALLVAVGIVVAGAV